MNVSPGDYRARFHKVSLAIAPGDVTALGGAAIPGNLTVFMNSQTESGNTVTVTTAGGSNVYVGESVTVAGEYDDATKSCVRSRFLRAKVPPFSRMATFGHSGSQAEQPVQVEEGINLEM